MRHNAEFEFWGAVAVIFAMMFVLWLLSWLLKWLICFLRVVYAVVLFYFTSFQNTLYWANVQSCSGKERREAVVSHIRNHIGDYWFMALMSARKFDTVAEIYVADVLEEGDVWPPAPKEQ